MKLTVWIMTQNDDSECYNIIARTKKDALAQAAARTYCTWSEPKRMVIEYKDAFDLFDLATGEGGGRSEYY
jgi:hypothetical protein